MITIPEDPVDILLKRVHGFALTLMDENLIISGGMNTPNKIVVSRLYFEQLPSEEHIRRRVAQYQRSLRNGQRMMVLYFTDASRHLRRAIRSASNR